MLSDRAWAPVAGILAVGVRTARHRRHYRRRCPLVADSFRRAVALRALAAERLGLPVEIDNDANLVTLAELLVRRPAAGWPTSAGFWLDDSSTGSAWGLCHRPPALPAAPNRVRAWLGHTIRPARRRALPLRAEGAVLEGLRSRICAGTGSRDVLVRRHPEFRPRTCHCLEWLHERAESGRRKRLGRVPARGFVTLHLASPNVITLYGPTAIILSGARLQFDFLFADDRACGNRTAGHSRRKGAPGSTSTHGAYSSEARGAATLALGHRHGPAHGEPRRESGRAPSSSQLCQQLRNPASGGGGRASRNPSSITGGWEQFRSAVVLQFFD